MSSELWDETASDHRRFEEQQVAQDADASRTSQPLSEDAVKRRFDELESAGVADVIPEEQLVVHLPSGETFQRVRDLVVFHQGWEVVADAESSIIAVERDTALQAADQLEYLTKRIRRYVDENQAKRVSSDLRAAVAAADPAPFAKAFNDE
jgi:hypothetical protein